MHGTGALAFSRAARQPGNPLRVLQGAFRPPKQLHIHNPNPKNPRLGSPSVSAETLNPKVKNLSFRSPGHSKVGAFNSTELARQEVQDLAEG